jgi:hypothetical protein
MQDQLLDGAKSCSFQIPPEFVLVYIFPEVPPETASSFVPVESDATDIQFVVIAPVLTQIFPELVLRHIPPVVAPPEAATTFTPSELKAILVQLPVGVFGTQLAPESVLTYNKPVVEFCPTTILVPSELKAMVLQTILVESDVGVHVVPESLLI